MSSNMSMKQVNSVFIPVLKELKTTIKIRVQKEKENTQALKMRAKEERERAKEERERARIVKEEERERAKENARLAKEQRMRAKESARLVKEEQREREKRLRIHEKETKRFEAFNRMIQVGIALHKTHLVGFTTAQFVEKFKQIYGNINAWSGDTNPEDYDGDASIRSLIYEMSPSSAQHWFKYGIKKNSYQVAPWAFVNKKLAELNDKYQWMITTKGTCRAKSKGTWKFVFHLSRESWDNELFGPLPDEHTLLNAKNQRKIGKQNQKN